APSAPTVSGGANGEVTVGLPADAKPGDKVTVQVTPENGTAAVPVTLTKNADGSWTSDNTDTIPSVVAGGTTATIPADKVADGSTVKATAQDAAGNQSAEGSTTAGSNPSVAIDKVAGDDVVNKAEAAAGFNVTGTGKEGQTIVLTDASGNKVGESVVKADGTWSIPVSQANITAMGEGADKLTATVKGSSVSAAKEISVDTVA
ncbi:Ig-like domain-containing protein, partial [Paralysiella testudinis]